MKLTFGVNLVLFTRCFLTAAFLLALPSVLLFGSPLPESWNRAVASVFQPRDEHDFKVHGVRDTEPESEPVPEEPASSWKMTPVEQDSEPRSPNWSETSSPIVSTRADTPFRYVHGGASANDVLHARLTELGVKQFNLCQWGNDGTLWRCSCRVATSESCSTCFEAVDNDSNRAIEIVLTKIDDWRARR